MKEKKGGEKMQQRNIREESNSTFKKRNYWKKLVNEEKMKQINKKD